MRWRKDIEMENEMEKKLDPKVVETRMEQIAAWAVSYRTKKPANELLDELVLGIADADAQKQAALLIFEASQVMAQVSAQPIHQQLVLSALQSMAETELRYEQIPKN